MMKKNKLFVFSEVIRRTVIVTAVEKEVACAAIEISFRVTTVLEKVFQFEDVGHGSVYVRREL